MVLTDILLIIAIITGPIISVQLTRWIDNKKEEKKRKINVFKTLMVTRNYNVTWSHVEALNRIDLEFNTSNKKEVKVIEAWDEYLKHLHNTTMEITAWGDRRTILLSNLLYYMANVLNYDYDRIRIRNSSYLPKKHFYTENDQLELRLRMLELLENKRSISVNIDNNKNTDS